jgi:hypothetical protein
MIVPARVQAVEVAAAVDPEQHGLAIDHERSVPVSQRRFGDQGKPIAPVVAVAREQADALALALHDQAVAVVLDLVNPFRPIRNRGAAGRNAGVEGLAHAG